MGSWSVYCGISKITISDGNECVLLPLYDKCKSYMKDYKPLTLPIFGKYNDYGGIKEIEKNNNTLLIEQYFGVPIEQFCEFLIDGEHGYDRSEARTIKQEIIKNIKGNEIASKIRYMWIDRKVYDYMTTNLDDWEIGNHELGKFEILTFMGFKKIDEESNENEVIDYKRHKHIFEKDGVRLYSDGDSLMSDENNGSHYIYRVGLGKENHTSIEYYVDIDDEAFNTLKSSTKFDIWQLLSDDDFKEKKGFIFGYNFSRYLHKPLKTDKVNYIYEKYFKSIELFGTEIIKLINVYRNMHCMSGILEPFNTDIHTPQCGEYNIHQKLLDKFSEINKSNLID